MFCAFVFLLTIFLRHFIARNKQQYKRKTARDMVYCVLYHPVGIALGVTRKSCRAGRHGAVMWTAGQRVNPSKKTTFVWKPASGQSIAMKYKQWYGRQPDFAGGKGGPESCLNLSSAKGYRWNDAACKHPLCSLCEYYD